MLKAGDLACREDRRVRGGSKSGKPDEIRGYHMYAKHGKTKDRSDI